MWEYFNNNSKSINEFLILIFSSWGISYAIFLWVSFFLIVIKNLPGCAWTGISQNFHICVDTVLNANLDDFQRKNGITAELLKTSSARLWIMGLILLLVFAFILTINFIPLDLRLIMLGVISSLYFLYEKSIHDISIGKPNLRGVEDYPDLLREFLGGPGRRQHAY